jgi:hypothetical protein
MEMLQHGSSTDLSTPNVLIAITSTTPEDVANGFYAAGDVPNAL